MKGGEQGTAGNSNESVNLGARFSKHGLLGGPLVLSSPVLLARSCVAGQEQRHTSVPACAEVGKSSRSWQRCPAWQGSRGPDLSGLKNRTGTRRTFVFSSGAGTGPSGCSQDVMASWLSREEGHTTLRHPGRSGWPRCTLALFPLCLTAEPEALPIQPGRGRSPGPPAGTSSHGKGTAFSWKPHCLSSRLTCPVSPGQVREFVPPASAKCDCCPWWHGALN